MEDNFPDVVLVREAIVMEALPVDLHVAPDGEKAIEFLERAETDPDAPCPDVALLDLNLPKIGGFEVLQRIRTSQKCGQTPVIVVTSSDAPKDLQEAASRGAGYFRKPPSYDEFLKIGPFLRRFLEMRGLLDPV